MENGLNIAKALSNNPRVIKVITPCRFLLTIHSYIEYLLLILLSVLESHPQHELYQKQMKGFGGMISIYIKGGMEEASIFMKSLNVF